MNTLTLITLVFLSATLGYRFVDNVTSHKIVAAALSAIELIAFIYLIRIW